MYRIVLYQMSPKRRPVEKFIKSLDGKTQAKLIRIIELLKEYGLDIGMPHSKYVKNGIFELRIRGKVEVRIFYVVQKKTIILLHGFIKKTNKIPDKELRLTLSRAKQLTKL